MLEWLRDKVAGKAAADEFEPIKVTDLKTSRAEPTARLETGSSTWVFIVNHCEGRLSALRDDNDGDLDQIKTANIRGQIQAIKDILDLPNPKGVDRWHNPSRQ